MLKKTLAITREAPSEIYVPQCFKPKMGYSRKNPNMGGGMGVEDILF